jgi:hypothetical protein
MGESMKERKTFQDREARAHRELLQATADKTLAYLLSCNLDHRLCALDLVTVTTLVGLHVLEVMGASSVVPSIRADYELFL